ncbi:MAG TPA: class I SAM-dependent methyltransferase [Gemmatimonadaceae bacterium]|nr:class I SAM-dependent methyltransferase [Gemmatimonadaceae bacterium]
MTKREHFDAEYYRKYYEDPATAVIDVPTQRNEVAFVLAFCRNIGVDIRRFADVGAGTGWWARAFAKQHPSCREIETFDASATACEMYGHRHATIQKLPGRAADLVVCRDVLRYVPTREVPGAIESLDRKCRGVLYLHVITSDDDIDTESSDMKGYFRSTAFYRSLLRSAGFRDCGMGLFVSGRLKHFEPWALDAR